MAVGEAALVVARRGDERVVGGLLGLAQQLAVVAVVRTHDLDLVDAHLGGGRRRGDDGEPEQGDEEGSAHGGE